MEDVNANQPYMVNELHENLADDPYSTAMYVIRRVLQDSMALSGLMSDSEFDKLVEINRLAGVKD